MGVLNRKRAWRHIAEAPDYRRSAHDLSPADKLLLLAIADVCSDEEGILKMGERKLADKVGQSRAWVRLHRPEIVKAGLLYPRGTWKPGQAISWQLFPEIYGAEASDFEPPRWVPSKSSQERDPSDLGSTGQDHGPVQERAQPLPTEPKPGRGPHKDRAGVLAIEPPQPLVRDEEKERDAREVSEADAWSNVLNAFPNAEVVSNG